MSPARVGIPGPAMGMDVIVEMSKVGVLGLTDNGTPCCVWHKRESIHFDRETALTVVLALAVAPYHMNAC